MKIISEMCMYLWTRKLTGFALMMYALSEFLILIVLDSGLLSD